MTPREPALPGSELPNLGVHIIRTEELRALVEEVERCRQLHLDKPEDRLYHASDQTWWKRENGALKSADHPPELELLREFERAFDNCTGNRGYLSTVQEHDCRCEVNHKPPKECTCGSTRLYDALDALDALAAWRRKK